MSDISVLQAKSPLANEGSKSDASVTYTIVVNYILIFFGYVLGLGRGRINRFSSQLILFCILNH